LIEKIKILKDEKSAVNFVRSPLSKEFNLVSEQAANSDHGMDELPRTILSDNGDAAISHD
jgi:hypothetical protein